MEIRIAGNVDSIPLGFKPIKHHSILYFQAAEHQLKMETGEIRLASIQARVLQCLYLLSRSRIVSVFSEFPFPISGYILNGGVLFLKAPVNHIRKC